MSIIGDINKIEHESDVTVLPEGEFEGKKVITRKPSNKRVDEVKSQIVPSIPDPEETSVIFGPIRRTQSVPAYKKRLAAAQRMNQSHLDSLPLTKEKPPIFKFEPSKLSREEIILPTQKTPEKVQDEEA
ncbi:MAG: hypothetical protein KBE16_02840 [Alphaproteobacteria bacterium]|nr:hypothetical protein [Alphaproteobacteria bacterium]MBP9877615.1 hypothetical protein [Alphaproteobacteria bacterium]